MPLYKTIKVNSQTTVKIWKIEESFNDLMDGTPLKPESLNRVNGMKSELHQRGFLSVRHLLSAFGYSDLDLYYDANGKPHLNDGKEISITHSFTFSGVIISDKKAGIDIEKQRDKIAKISSKFVDYEFKYLDQNSTSFVRKLTVIWGIKESLYKLFATPGMLFKTHFFVIPFMLNDLKTKAWIDYNNLKAGYTCEFLEFEGFTCAYAIEE
tara:strand:- start:1082 stop:1711 length:630 start_codon:yes stop_codon:yes gene_type:complete